VPRTTKSDLILLAQERMLDARALSSARRVEAAYYLAGYAVEAGLKAHVAKQTAAEEFPDRRRVLDAHSHDLAKLVQVAGLKIEVDERRTKEARFDQNWATVLNWNPEVRYQVPGKLCQADVELIISAIDDPQDGVLTWLKSIL
jgi:hypothetical protein